MKKRMGITIETIYTRGSIRDEMIIPGMANENYSKSHQTTLHFNKCDAYIGIYASSHASPVF